MTTPRERLRDAIANHTEYDPKAPTYALVRKDDDQDGQYKVTDALVFMAVSVVMIVLCLTLAGCQAAPTEPPVPPKPPRPPRPGVCWGTTPGCVSL